MSYTDEALLRVGYRCGFHNTAPTEHTVPAEYAEHFAIPPKYAEHFAFKKGYGMGIVDATRGRNYNPDAAVVAYYTAAEAERIRRRDAGELTIPTHPIELEPHPGNPTCPDCDEPLWWYLLSCKYRCPRCNVDFVIFERTP